MKQDYAIYVHIPFCKARCGYCAFSSCVDFSLCDKYFDVLCREIGRANAADVTIKTMFWGGGTPSAVAVKYLAKLYDALKEKFDLQDLDEFTVELNPESVTGELLAFLKSIKVNRLSFGLQSVNDETLKRVGRLHDYATFLSALQLARDYGFDNVNADLILGLPENVGDFNNTVDKVVQLSLKHLSLYALEIHEENESFKRLCESFHYCDDELADMYDYAKAAFERAGLMRYEVSNFARAGYECKHNLTYWTENRYFGFGASASGFVGNVRYGNTFDVFKYVEGDGKCFEYREEISNKEEAYEYVMLGLRLQKGFSIAQFEKRFKLDFYSTFTNFKKLCQAGFVCESGGRVFVPDDKFYVLNSILTELLPD